MTIFFSKLYKYLKKAPFFRYQEYGLKDRLSVIFLLTGLICSTIPFILTLIFKLPFWMNSINLACMIICLFLPIVMIDRIFQATILALFFVSIFYFPFIFFTNAGNNGTAPIYFVLIMVYFSFYLKRKTLILTLSFLLIYYTSIMIIGYFHPEFVIPYPDAPSKLIDLCMAVITVSIAMSIIASATFESYNRERDHAINLMNELKIKNKQLEELSIKDQLTGLYNRRHFSEILEKELRLAKQENNTFNLLMIDIDHFKRINDNYGHLFGDEILKLAANGIVESLRNHDIVARFGGEEFIVLLPNTNNEDGFLIAERIRKYIEKIEYRNERLITVSIGITKNTQGDRVVDVVKRADHLLYVAKEKGRNRVENNL